jgi:hypothetical protein
MAAVHDPTAMQQEADLKEVYRLFAEGKPGTDPELIRRIRERSFRQK